MATAAPRMQLAPDLDTGLAQLGCGSVCEGCAAKPLALLQRREKQAAARHRVGRVWPFSRRRPVRLTACGRLVGGEQPGGLQSSQQHQATGERTASANTALRKGGEWAFKQNNLRTHDTTGGDREQAGDRAKGICPRHAEERH